ncbi:APC family permease [uncultured Amaricoccus sp.]|uniref:APC family permease n=1 Tax=uncultured Amaricoccus sp. TaxID=339341 RepID=UPI00260B9F1D|nr:APC family permease [uncultured Amaricoccus sp.]
MTALDIPATSKESLGSDLGTMRLIFLIVAAAAPMAAVLGVVPVAFAFGNGAGLPLTFLVTAGILGLFAVGYSAMSREIVSAGGFYTYIARGLGAAPALGAAFLAIVSYLAFACGVIGYFGFFGQLALAEVFGIDVHWIVTAGFSILFCACLGYRQIDFSSRLVALLLIVEFVLLTALALAIVVDLGLDAFPVAALNPALMLDGAPGIALMLCFTCFIGIEAAALYSEEAQAPEHSIGRATMGAIVLVVAFYFFITWVTIGAVGMDIGAVSREQLADLYFNLSSTYLGGLATKMVIVFLATSMLATGLAVHNVAARYLLSLGRQECLPGFLARVHPRHRSPHLASLTVTAISVAATLIFLTTGLDPLLGFGAVGVGLGTIGIIALQALTSLAVIGYFHRRGRSRLWATIIAPLLAFAGLSLATGLAVVNFDLLAGYETALMRALPVLLLLTLVAGFGYGRWLRAYRPHAWEAVSRELSA